jgi:hypothetical protein
MAIELDPLERKAMELLLAGDDPTLNVLREQYHVGEVIKRELTGAGFHVAFSVPPAAVRLDARKSLHFGDVKAEIEGLQYGAGFVLHVRDGVIDQLEGYSYDEPWPVNVDSFHLSYIEGNERDLATLWERWA